MTREEYANNVSQMMTEQLTGHLKTAEELTTTKAQLAAMQKELEVAKAALAHVMTEQALNKEAMEAEDTIRELRAALATAELKRDEYRKTLNDIYREYPDVN